MAATASFENTTILNTTEHFDYFCVKLSVGPLVWAVISVLCTCIGVPASVWLLRVLVQRHRSGSSTNAYMFSLTVMDLIYNIFKLPSVLNYLVWHNFNFNMLSAANETLNFNGRPLFMACCCVDCYMAVVHPIIYIRISQSSYRAVVCSLVWVLLLPLALVLQFLVIQYHIITYGTLVPRILSIITIAFCDLLIFLTLRRPDPSGRSDVHPQKQRALQTITNSFIMTLICYLPSLLVYMFVPAMGLPWQQIYCHIVFPVTASSSVGSTLLPLLYLGNLGKLTISWKFRCSR